MYVALLAEFAQRFVRRNVSGWFKLSGQDGKPETKSNRIFHRYGCLYELRFCSEFCPFDAIKMDHQFELCNYERRQSHVYDLQDLLVSTEYYAKTHPRAWAKNYK